MLLVIVRVNLCTASLVGDSESSILTDLFVCFVLTLGCVFDEVFYFLCHFFSKQFLI